IARSAGEQRVFQSGEARGMGRAITMLHLGTFESSGGRGSYDHPMVQETRVRRLSDEAVRDDGRYVLYWMQQSQRARFNHALEYAAERANGLGRPLLVGFGLMDDYPEANER